MAKLSKANVEYRYINNGPDRCGHCTHFDAPDLCKIVWGIISSKGHCVRYDEKDGGLAAPVPAP